MRFQGENCTLSMGLSFAQGQAQLTGSIGLRRPITLHSADQPPRLHFDTLLPETDLVGLQHWLTEGSTEPFGLPDPIRLIRRLNQPTDDLIHLELEYHRQSVPPWWNWEITQPLKIRLDIRPNEFAYLTQLLSRDNWGTNLSW